MSLDPCANCADHQGRASTAARLAVVADQQGRYPARDRYLQTVQDAKADLAECRALGHPSMERSRQAARDRHAAARADPVTCEAWGCALLAPGRHPHCPDHHQEDTRDPPR